MRYGFLFAVIAGFTLALAPGSALASHYAVTDVPTLISAGDAEKLKKGGVTTTEEMLTKVATAKDRKALAKASGLSAASITTIAKRCDLLQVKGIGPEMVLLLEAAGVKTTGELAKKDAAELTAATEKANKAKKITEKPPTEPQFKDWIDQAKALPAAVEGK
jgi:predicted flap endonuclease-1-like 5' DNA nuclease